MNTGERLAVLSVLDELAREIPGVHMTPELADRVHLARTWLREGGTPEVPRTSPAAPSNVRVIPPDGLPTGIPVGARVRLHSGAEVGTVVGVSPGGHRLLVRWDDRDRLGMSLTSPTTAEFPEHLVTLDGAVPSDFETLRCSTPVAHPHHLWDRYNHGAPSKPYRETFVCPGVAP